MTYGRVFLKQPTKIIFLNTKGKEKKYSCLLWGGLFLKKTNKAVMLLNFGNALSDIFDFHLMYTVTPTGILMRQ